VCTAIAHRQLTSGDLDLQLVDPQTITGGQEVLNAPHLEITPGEHHRSV
jgi:hypothetical protein